MHDRHYRDFVAGVDGEDSDRVIRLGAVGMTAVLVVNLISAVTFLFLAGVGIHNMWTRWSALPPLQEALQCSPPCVVKSNPGGKAYTFIEAALSLKEGDVVAIDGPCISACALFADLGRPYVCVTERAYFLFHAARDRSHTRHDGQFLRADPPHSADIREYVYELGGFTESEELEEYPALAYPDTLKFWPQCGPYRPKPR